MIETGRVVAGYEIQERISEGGMATVYRARRLRDGLVCALKVLRDQYAADAEFVERFQREARAVQSLSHPHMVQVFESGQAQGVHFIAMEFVEGPDLKRYLRERGPLAPAEAVRIAVQVCEVLDYAHRHGIVHRDIKPQNILLAPDGQVKVADFGIARALAAVTITQTGTVLGSVQYLAPEQARGQPAGQAADLYAVAVVLYEMLTGQLPFDGDSPIAIALRHIHDAPPPPRRLNPAIPPSLEGVILRGMAKRPEHRYPSARAMATDLLGETAFWREPPGASAAEATLVARPQGTGGRRRDTRPAPAVAPRSGRSERRGRDRLRGRADAGRTWTPAVVTLAVVTVGLLIGGVWATWRTVSAYFNVAEVEVPRFIGLPLPEAQARAAEARLGLAVQGRAYSAEVPKDAVLSQDQPPGKRVKVGRVVQVVVSLGPELVTVPDVQGQGLLQARLAIEDARLRVGQIDEAFSDAVRGGLIITQDPVPGAQVPRGSAVALVVSRGPELVEVPLLVGRSLREARRRLEDLGLILRHVRQAVSPDLEPGIVVDQEPAAGTKVRAAEAEVVLTVSVRPGAEGRPPEAPVVTVERRPTPAPTQASPGAEQPTRDPPGTKRTAVRVVVPEGPGPQRVRIVVIDQEGVRTAYQREHEAGERVNVLVRSRGYTIIQIYLDNRLVQEIRP
ncbi:MAG: Stk1 family PASTA domain-containing Ser/Thr kinase [Armatimonadota bacterium]|nr:Stk1 family PASTA domain-containing Ser/Thr kinase [Armatimonadota bacterium]